MQLFDVLKISNPGMKRKTGRFGVEIETETLSGEAYKKGFLTPQGPDVEGHTIYTTPLKMWDTKTDGSLRNFGIEYILKNPMNIDEVEVALAEFEALDREVDFLVDQPSTSVHVHMNFQNETPLTIANFLHVWTLYENLLIEFCGAIRRSNCFALGTRHADMQIENIIKMFKNVEQGVYQAFTFNQQTVKYASMNLGTLSKLGTLEARSFRGVTDVGEIRRWLGILNNLFEFAKTPGMTPHDVAMQYKEKGPELLTDVFGQYSSLLKCDGYEAMIERNEVYFYALVTAVKNWKTFGLSFERMKKEPRFRAPKNNFGASLVNMTDTVTMNDFIQMAQLLTGGQQLEWPANLVAEIEEDSF